ncbi:MAG: hypothetical protein D6679_07960 [Candidatus Hydrogenedentota bacterium]|nr:MAG: hypothetical protein D6679_07960 [Candidatus Hydrogenedentota bacterium]
MELKGVVMERISDFNKQDGVGKSRGFGMSGRWERPGTERIFGERGRGFPAIVAAVICFVVFTVWSPVYADCFIFREKMPDQLVLEGMELAENKEEAFQGENCLMAQGTKEEPPEILFQPCDISHAKAIRFFIKTLGTEPLPSIVIESFSGKNSDVLDLNDFRSETGRGGGYVEISIPISAFQRRGEDISSVKGLKFLPATDFQIFFLDDIEIKGEVRKDAESEARTFGGPTRRPWKKDVSESEQEQMQGGEGVGDGEEVDSSRGDSLEKGLNQNKAKEEEEAPPPGVPAKGDKWVLIKYRQLVQVQTANNDVLVLVFRDNGMNDPPPQDANAYTINGEAPPVVGRYSAPIFEGPNVDWKTQRYPVIVMHRMYLPLPNKQMLEEGKTYHITYPGGETTIVFSSRTVLCESIKVNQVGYNPKATQKYAFVAVWMGDLGGHRLKGKNTFEVVNEKTGKVVLTGDVDLVHVAPPNSKDKADVEQEVGGPFYLIDLSKVRPQPGEFFIAIPGLGRSYDFGLDDKHVFHSFYVHMKGFYHQRCGIALEEPYTKWTRGICHTKMTITDADPPDFIKEKGTEVRKSIGGHHDAGDFDQRLSHTLVPGWLMNAYELFPEKFVDGQLDIPEGHNGIPDILDEALWAIKRWEVLQEADGGIRAGVESYRHPYAYGSDEANAAADPLEYRTYKRYGHTTLAGAALFAWASRLVRRFNEEKANELAERAKRAWGFYEMVLKKKKEAEAKVSEDEYTLEKKTGDVTDLEFSKGVLLYAACQLYLLTGEEKYHRVFREIAKYYGTPPYGEWPAQYNGTYYNLKVVNKGMVFTHYFISYLLDKTRRKDPETVELLRKAVLRKADIALYVINRRKWAYLSSAGWGMSTALGRWGDFLLNAYGLTRDQKYFDGASRIADYVLGANPPGWCFTTGLGDRPPYDPLHLDSYKYIKKGMGPAPGIVIYGSPLVQQVPYMIPVVGKTHPLFYDGKVPLMREIVDGWSVVLQNEFTIWETMAPNTFLHACLAPEKPLKGQQLPMGEPKIPGGYPDLSRFHIHP